MIMNFVYLQKKWEGCAKNTWLTKENWYWWYDIRAFKKWLYGKI